MKLLASPAFWVFLVRILLQAGNLVIGILHEALELILEGRLVHRRGTELPVARLRTGRHSRSRPPELRLRSYRRRQRRLDGEIDSAVIVQTDDLNSHILTLRQVLPDIVYVGVGDL